LNAGWVPRETRDAVVDMVREWSKKSGVGVKHFIGWLDISRSKYYDWHQRYGQENQHNGQIPRSFWLEEWERQAIVDYYRKHPGEGYRRLTYMMLDADVVAASPSSIYRVLKRAGELNKWVQSPSRKGKGFDQPTKPHEHWHIDIAYINICGTFYYLCTILDGYSRFVVHWEIRESMTQADVEIVVQRAREKSPGENPRIISDNGPQFISRGFKEYIRISGMTHVRTAPYYPQSNGKVERWHKSLKTECIRPKTPLSLADARRVVNKFVKCYNDQRLHSAIGYVTPRDKLLGKEPMIFAERKRKLETARKRRAERQAVGEPIPALALPSQTATCLVAA
jgi:transposase InsO family protein